MEDSIEQDSMEIPRKLTYFYRKNIIENMIFNVTTTLGDRKVSPDAQH